MRIGFHHDSFSLRGVDQASFEYAKVCEEILGDEVLILKSNRKESGWISDNISDIVRARFNVIDYDGSVLGLKELVRRLQLEALYTLNTGYLDERFNDLDCLLWNHSVFPESKMEHQVKGFAVVSKWLSKEYFAGKSRVVPHIVPRIKDGADLRNKLGIPTGDIVLGSMGGRWNFNSKAAVAALASSLEKRNDLWFISMNQVVCASHERIIELPGTGVEAMKHAFIQTCDYMLHGRSEGETFGISCGEFCSAGKPVIAWGGTPQRAHLEQFVLGENSYSSSRHLEEIIGSLTKQRYGCDKSRALALAYEDRKVSGEFEHVFHKGGNQVVPCERALDKVGSLLKYGRRRIRVSFTRRDQISNSVFRDYAVTESLTE